MSTPTNRKVLISGASIAGPALAYWLSRAGEEVTVVEKASTIRGGGYPIDVRGTAVDVIERMGILPKIQDAHIDTQQVTFVNARGKVVGSARPEAMTGGVEGRDYELPRGALASALGELTRDAAEYLFSDSIAELREHDGGVDVTLDSGMERTFDLVVGADGLHSNVRQLVFGQEHFYHRYLGWCFAGFSLPNHLGLNHGSLLYNAPGRMASLYPVGDRPDRVIGLLAFKAPLPDYDTLRDDEAMRRLAFDAFAGTMDWEIPLMRAELLKAEDAFCDSISQIHMPTWSNGRVVLVGDAAHATSFLSGQGSSVAIVSPYVLAGELVSGPSHARAFTSFEQKTRAFVELNQAIAHRNNGVCVEKASELAVRNLAIRFVLPLLVRSKLAGRLGRKNRLATTALQLPTYERLHTQVSI